MIIHLTASDPVFELNLPARTSYVKVASAGSWTGEVKMGYKMLVSGDLNDSPVFEEAGYEDGEFYVNFNKVFNPATDITKFELIGSGDCYIEVTPARFAGQ